MGLKKGRKRKAIITDGEGRRRIRIENHPNATVQGRVLISRLLSEIELDRFLTKNEVVHHKNLNPGDDSRNNRQAMTCGEHMSLHAELRYGGPKSEEVGLNRIALRKLLFS